jgi:hypothetical protein
MVRKALILFLFIGARVLAQDSSFVYKHVLKASATLCPGFMFNQAQTNIYVHGHLEFFPEEKVSLRGDGFWFTGAQQKPSLFKQNSTLLFGALMHAHRGRVDGFIGLQTGMSFTQPENTYSDYVLITSTGTTTTQMATIYKLKALPVFSPFAGVTFYPGKYVNFFLEMRYITGGKYYGYTSGSTIFMDELRVSAGLGFQIPFK